MELKYKRILLKLSGEALAGDKKTGLDYNVITPICRAVKRCADAGALTSFCKHNTIQNYRDQVECDERSDE